MLTVDLKILSLSITIDKSFISNLLSFKFMLILDEMLLIFVLTSSGMISISLELK